MAVNEFAKYFQSHTFAFINRKHIVTTLEEAMSAFNDLTQVVDDLVPFGLAPDAAQILKNSISTSHAYVQHNFIHNIAMESDVAHHCVTLGGHHVLWILELRNESCG